MVRRQVMAAVGTFASAVLLALAVFSIHFVAYAKLAWAITWLAVMLTALFSAGLVLIRVLRVKDLSGFIWLPAIVLISLDIVAIFLVLANVGFAIADIRAHGFPLR
jgi:hypothetical protein